MVKFRFNSNLTAWFYIQEANSASVSKPVNCDGARVIKYSLSHAESETRATAALNFCTFNL